MVQPPAIAALPRDAAPDSMSMVRASLPTPCHPVVLLLASAAALLAQVMTRAAFVGTTELPESGTLSEGPLTCHAAKTANLALAKARLAEASVVCTSVRRQSEELTRVRVATTR